MIKSRILSLPQSRRPEYFALTVDVNQAAHWLAGLLDDYQCSLPCQHAPHKDTGNPYKGLFIVYVNSPIGLRSVFRMRNDCDFVVWAVHKSHHTLSGWASSKYRKVGSEYWEISIFQPTQYPDEWRFMARKCLTMPSDLSNSLPTLY